MGNLLNTLTQPVQDGMSMTLSYWYLFTGQTDKAAEIIVDNIIIKELQDRLSKVFDAYLGMAVVFLFSGVAVGGGWVVGKMFDGFGLYSA